MANSFQTEIPKARINITLDVATEGAHKKKELPLKLLVTGDFSNGKTKGPITKRERININKNNFDNIITDLTPELNFTVVNKIKNDGSEMKVNLQMDSMQKFRPESIAQEIPELRNLLAMRNLLKDLKANLLDNDDFRRGLEKVVRVKPELKLLQNELQQKAQIKEI